MRRAVKTGRPLSAEKPPQATFQTADRVLQNKDPTIHKLGMKTCAFQVHRARAKIFQDDMPEQGKHGITEHRRQQRAGPDRA